MKRAFFFVLACVFAMSIASRATAAEPDPAIAEGARNSAFLRTDYAFCTHAKELHQTDSAARLCNLAREVPQCKSYAKACDDLKPTDVDDSKKDNDWFGWLSKSSLAMFGQIVMWLLIAVAAGALLTPIVRALLRMRRDREVADKVPEIEAASTIVKTADIAYAPGDAESLLAKATELARSGRAGESLSYYLAASLSALDKRGAVRLARHRTNGEYVRLCSDASAKAPLREIVNEVDRVEFGGREPNEDAVTRVASRAGHLVRAAMVAMLVIVSTFFMSGCAPTKRLDFSSSADGDSLLLEVLARENVKAGRLRGSLAKLPMPDAAHPAPLLIIDLTAKERPTKATMEHVMTWVKAGGRLVLLGPPERWPSELGSPETAAASGTDVKVWAPESLREDDEDVHPKRFTAPAYEGRVAVPIGLRWPSSSTVASIGKAPLSRTSVPYAALYSYGEGVVLGVASDDLFTNIGMAREGNAATAIALLASLNDGVDREIRFAHHENDVDAPESLFGGMVNAGLAPGLLQGLIAAIALIFAAGVRHAKPIPTAAETRRAFTEHVEATGAFWARAKATPLALASFAKLMDERLRARMPRGHTDPAMYLAERAGSPPEETRDLYARAMSTKIEDAPRADDLLVLRKLRAMYLVAIKNI